jgi:hypothetical protein
MPCQVTSKHWHQFSAYSFVWKFHCLISSWLLTLKLSNAVRKCKTFKYGISNESGTSNILISFHRYLLLKFMSEEEWLSIGNTHVLNSYITWILHKQHDHILYGHHMKGELRVSIQTSVTNGHHCKTWVFNISIRAHKTQSYTNIKTGYFLSLNFLPLSLIVISLHITDSRNYTNKSKLVFINENVHNTSMNSERNLASLNSE